MSLALTTCAKLPFGFEARALINLSRRDLPCHSFSGRPRSLHRLAPTLCSTKASAGKHISYVTEFSSYLHDLTGRILDASPQPLKEFPWEKAKLMVRERLLVLGKNMLAWSLVTLLICNILYDALMAVFISRELLVPLGLFTGVLLADFLNETCQELFQSKAKGGNDMQLLWGIGLFFLALRFIFLRFRIVGWMLFCHIGNGGLMQILWLAKEMQQAEILQNKEEEVDALPPS
ncbi:uncharacterized protein LOC110018022 [Phalaenopsis equestris]|uniref:uncharacterized protein LOC110018022 n=1 Tax=Phalaenopsis equestris TaxID=78828 RepID=UPI0009E1BE36|nr:uncharacterized protein LOC110018022 [Phalaenopsis equestris]